MQINEIIGYVVIGIGIACVILGLLGIFRFKNFFPRILVSSKIDTVGTITVIFGLIIRNGISFFSGKMVLLLAVVLILNPLCTHMVARSAYLSGYSHSDDKANKENNDEDPNP